MDGPLPILFGQSTFLNLQPDKIGAEPTHVLSIICPYVFEKIYRRWCHQEILRYFEYKSSKVHTKNHVIM